MIRRPVGAARKLLIIHKDTDHRFNGEIRQRRIVFTADFSEKFRCFLFIIIRFTDIKQVIHAALALDDVAHRLTYNVFK